MFKIDGKNAFVCDENEFSGVKKIADKVLLLGIKVESLQHKSIGI